MGSHPSQCASNHSPNTLLSDDSPHEICDRPLPSESSNPSKRAMVPVEKSPSLLSRPVKSKQITTKILTKYVQFLTQKLLLTQLTTYYLPTVSVQFDRFA